MASQYRTRGYRPGEIVHITCRGFRKQRIFLDRHDHDWFLDRFCELNSALPVEAQLTLLANAQMDNHQHLLARNANRPGAITAIMHRLCTEYAIDFNWRQHRSGQVFERPFRGKVIRSTEHLVNAFAYIHLNPDHSLRLDNSSHGIYAGVRSDPRFDTTLGLRALGGREGYMKFIEDTARIRDARKAGRRRLEDW